MLSKNDFLNVCFILKQTTKSKMSNEGEFDNLIGECHREWEYFSYTEKKMKDHSDYPEECIKKLSYEKDRVGFEEQKEFLEKLNISLESLPDEEDRVVGDIMGWVKDNLNYEQFCFLGW